MNIRGMFLHMIGDALGSIGVLISAIIIKWGKFSWRFYFDPICSLIVCFLILRGAIPLFIESGKILLLGCPSSVDPKKIIKEIEDVSLSDLLLTFFYSTSSASWRRLYSLIPYVGVNCRPCLCLTSRFNP